MRPVTLLRPRAVGGYTDADALNDIHVLLTATSPGDATLADVAQILVRTGRPLVAARDIEITMTETALGWPVACAQAGDTSVFIRQAPADPVSVRRAGRSRNRPLAALARAGPQIFSWPRASPALVPAAPAQSFSLPAGKHLGSTGRPV